MLSRCCGVMARLLPRAAASSRFPCCWTRSMSWTRPEENSLASFAHRTYYPAVIGQIINNRYRIVTKLGFGAYSTVWLARDKSSGRHVSLKISVQDDAALPPIQNEIVMLRHMQACAERGDHPGSNFIRLSEDMFDMDGPAGRHTCIVFKPQGCNLWTLRHMFPDQRLPRELVTDVIHRLLLAVNFMHAACDLIHTDISSQNVLISLANEEAFFNQVEHDVSTVPGNSEMVGHCMVHQSQGLPRSLLDISERPFLTDFGSTRMADPPSKDWCMPDTYRAPEMLLGLPWDFVVDVWSIGIMALELIEGRNLFEPIDHEYSQYVFPWAMAQYVACLGPPPVYLLDKTDDPRVKEYFDQQGKWIHEYPVPDTSLEEFVTAIPPGPEKTKFLKFIRRILTWDPEMRPTTMELFEDEWLLR